MDMNDVRAVLLKILACAAVFGAGAAATFLWVHPSWLAFTSGGLLLFVGLLSLLISPSGTGHVLDNLVSYVIVSILVVVLAIGVGQQLAKYEARKEKSPSTLEK